MIDTQQDTASGVYRVLSATVWRPEGSAVEALLRMRAALATRNRVAGLRSALLHAGGWLVQWHEGPREIVNLAWSEAASAPGHSHARTLHVSEGEAMLKDAVQLVTLHSRERPADFAQRLMRIEREQALGWAAEPVDIWQALSAPCQMDAKDPMGTLLRRRVALVTSEDNESVEFLRSLAERMHTRVAYQRFAGGDVRQADAGGGYVDVRWSGCVARVQALARQALAQDVVRFSVGNLQWLVMLLGQRERAAAALVASVAPLIASFVNAPTVLLMGPNGGMCRTAAAALQKVRPVNVLQLDAVTRDSQSHIDAVMNTLCADMRQLRSTPPAIPA